MRNIRAHGLLALQSDHHYVPFYGPSSLTSLLSPDYYVAKPAGIKKIRRVWTVPIPHSLSRGGMSNEANRGTATMSIFFRSCVLCLPTFITGV